MAKYSGKDFHECARICFGLQCSYTLSSRQESHEILFDVRKYDTTDTCKAGNFEMLKLPGKTITATVYLLLGMNP